jgi:hypothetical protein
VHNYLIAVGCLFSTVALRVLSVRTVLYGCAHVLVPVPGRSTSCWTKNKK